MRIPSYRWRSARHRQLVLPFVERRLRLERRFKRAIVASTGLVVSALFLAFPWGSYLSASIDSWAGRTFRESLHLIRSRDEIDESWVRFRRASFALTRDRVRSHFEGCDPAFRKLLLYAGMDPEHALLGWGNYDWTLLLSSKVFEGDERCSYRLRPGVRSIWLRNVGPELGIGAFFLVPDGPGLDDAIRGTTAAPLSSSRQSTNSWGFRGPEPDPDAPLRVLVLGDSYMQGMFIGDDETPPEYLRRDLDRDLGIRCSVLNAGLMGYSPEQYYYSMRATADRFRPHFVVVSLFANDCGELYDAVSRGVGDWREGKYWLERIARDCQEHGRPCLIVPVPFEPNVIGRRKPAFYPGALANLLNIEGPAYLDPMDDFLNAHLRARIEARRQGRPVWGCALFNDELHDTHFSPAGAAAWAESVGRRLILMMEDGGILSRGNRPTAEDPRSASGNPAHREHSAR